MFCYSTLVADGVIADDELAEDPQDKHESGDAHKCSQCKRGLFKTQNLVHHVDGCKYYFIEPVLWMKVMIMDFSGTLNCPQCKSDVGDFCWKVSECGKCSCSYSSAPSFRILATHVTI